MGETIEDYLQLDRSNVVFYDSNEFTIAIKKLGYANGINVSEDGNILYVAETVGKKYQSMPLISALMSLLLFNLQILILEWII